MANIDKGKIFNRLTVLGFAYSKSNRLFWYCACNCGNFCVVAGIEIRKGQTKSCGCLKKDSFKKVITKHGKISHPMYTLFSGIMGRCFCSSATNYKEYGGRGITVCDRWLESEGKGFLNFLQDMGERPEGTSIDRIDVNGNYCKENCRWVDYGIQNFNKNMQSNNTSGHVGIFNRGSSYRVYISFKGKKINLGSCKNIEDAVKLRKEGEMKYYGFTLRD